MLEINFTILSRLNKSDYGGYNLNKKFISEFFELLLVLTSFLLIVPTVPKLNF